jgi:hypothetical protein
MSFKNSVSLVAITALIGAVLLSTLLLSVVKAKGSNQSDPKIEGTWEVTVNLSVPGLPPSFEALETYNRDGGLITSNNMPFLTRVGQGGWERVGQEYVVKIKFFKFDPSGLPSGTINVTHTVRINDDKNEYDGRGTAEFCELDGTCQSVGFNSTGRRLEIGQ